jgi:dolichol-phosphate mannosyltransferase
MVDDASPDGTAELANSFEFNWVRLISRKGKLGLGSAYKLGFTEAINKNYKFVYEMDADGSHRVIDLPKLIRVQDSADLVIGSRWVSGGQIVNWPFRRKFISKFGNFYAKSLLDLHVKDATSGFRRLRVEALKTLNFKEVSSRGYSFQIEITCLFQKSGKEIQEVPIVFVERLLGNSKMTTEIAIEAFKLVSRLGIKRFLNE